MLGSAFGRAAPDMFMSSAFDVRGGHDFSHANSQRLRPLLAFAAFKAAGNRVLLFDVFPFVKKDPPHRRRCRNATVSMRFERQVPPDKRVPP